MENLKILNKKELCTINGGNFAWDAGWLLGHLIVGDFGNPPGTVDAYMDYIVYYTK